ncbi:MULTISPECIES: DUF2933 domain-containing protein [Anoxynatronum]|uniref:DUF2933 domain-containing protein n=2 Tax=Anoxynatronum TaxID=210622 RepID=A0AA45WZ06_9CLOT|nr:DUF2933 domain-containing protein [Anoxynatronum buryatiense]SMP71631.1 Protein of unknown function [Anoxynatronum buryatiense]
MNHCNRNGHNEQHEKKGHKHGLMMLLCLVPMIALIALPRMGIDLGFLGRLVPFAVFLICPLMHIGMMLMMRDHGKKEDHLHTGRDQHQLQD